MTSQRSIYPPTHTHMNLVGEKTNKHSSHVTLAPSQLRLGGAGHMSCEVLELHVMNACLIIFRQVF